MKMLLLHILTILLTFGKLYPKEDVLLQTARNKYEVFAAADHMLYTDTTEHRTHNIYNIKQSLPHADGISDDTPAFIDAFNKADAVFISKGVYAINSSLKIPAGKKLVFDKGAYMEVNGKMIGNHTEIEAGFHQIFTIESNITGTWIYSEAYPEWFGAKGDSLTKSGAAIGKCLKTFVSRVKVLGENYLIEQTINFPQFGDLEMGANTRFTNTFRMYDPIISITREKFYLKGGTIQILHYKDMDDGVWLSGTDKDAYKGWVIDMKLERDAMLKDKYYRQNSYIKNLSIIPVKSYSEKNKQHLLFDGIRITSSAKHDASYFVEVSNLYIRQADTALYLQGHPESGMINSWHFNSYTSDGSLHAIVLGNRAAGNIFTNTVIQPFTAKPWGKTVQVDIASMYNRIEGVFWDIHCDSSVVLRYNPDNKPNKIEAAHNTIDLNVNKIHNYLIEERAYYNYNNIITPAGFRPSKYYDGVVTVQGNGRMRIGGYDDTYLHRGERLQVAGNLEFYSINESRVKILRVVNLGEGNVPVRDNMQWILRFIDDNGDTSYFTKPVTKIITEQPQKIRIDFTAPMDARVKKTLIYRQKKAGADYYFVGAVYNTDTSYIDNKPDSKLGNKANFNKGDPTAGGIYKDGSRYMMFSDKNVTVSKSLTVKDVLKLKPRESPPLHPTEGELYVNAVEHHIYCFLNGTWKRLD